MTTFQIILLVVFALGGLLAVVGTMLRSLGLIPGLLWLGVMAAACIATIRPSLTTDLAKILGIGRGVDLLLYCLVVFSMLGFLLFYVRLRRLRSELTLLVRRLAIQEAWTDDAAASDQG